MSRRKFSKEFKLAAVRRIQAGEPVPYLALVLEVNPSDLYRWHRESQQLGEPASASPASAMLHPKPIPFNAKAANGKSWVNRLPQPRSPLQFGSPVRLSVLIKAKILTFS